MSTVHMEEDAPGRVKRYSLNRGEELTELLERGYYTSDDKRHAGRWCCIIQISLAFPFYADQKSRVCPPLVNVNVCRVADFVSGGGMTISLLLSVLQLVEIDMLRTGDESELVSRLAALYEGCLEEPSRAIDVYAAAVGRQPESTAWLSALVRLYKAADDTSSAAARLERLLELSDDEDVLAYALDLAELSIGLGDKARAITALQKALAVDERNADVRARLAGLYEETGAWDDLVGLWVGDAEHAKSIDDKIALLRRASTLRSEKLGDAAGAVELLERARDASPDDRELLLEVCDAYSKAGRADDAVHALEQIVESYGGRRSKELADIHRRIANACLARGESERALTELDRAFRIQPGNLQVLNQLGRLSLENNDLKKAQQMFRALLLQKLGDDAPITKAEVFMFLGQVHAGLGEKAKAVQNLESAIRTDPDLERAKELLEEAKAEG